MDGYTTLISTTGAGMTVVDLFFAIDADREYQHYRTPTLQDRDDIKEDYEGAEDGDFVKEVTEEVEALRRVVSFRLHVPKSLEEATPKKADLSA